MEYVIVYLVVAVIVAVWVSGHTDYPLEALLTAILWPVLGPVALVIVQRRRYARYQTRFPQGFSFRPWPWGYSARQRRRMVVSVTRRLVDGWRRYGPAVAGVPLPDRLNNVPGLTVCPWLDQHEQALAAIAEWAADNRLPVVDELAPLVAAFRYEWVPEPIHWSAGLAVWLLFSAVDVMLAATGTWEQWALLGTSDGRPGGILVAVGLTLGMLVNRHVMVRQWRRITP